MFNKLLRFIGNLGYALLFALFGGYLAAAIICMLLSWLLGLIGFNITTSDIIGSYAGAAILAVCCVLFGLAGFGIGMNIQEGIKRFFGGK